MKLKDDEYIDKLEFVKMPNVQKPQWRWILRKTDNNRFIVRAPKTNILIKNLKYKREKDFKDEMLLPLGSIIDPYGKKTRKWKKNKKNKYKYKKTMKNKKQ
jgi:hypothetical protein